MGKQRLTDAVVRRLLAPAKGNKITFDADTAGFGVRVTAAGARAFVLCYRNSGGRQRRYTLGAFPDWSASAAREEARRLKRDIRANGADPIADLEAVRGAPTVADLCERYIAEHLPKKRPLSQADDRSLIRQWIVPEMRHAKVAEVSFAAVDDLHRKVTAAGTPIRANRAVSLLSKMMSLAIRWHWRTDNPCRGVEKNQEQKRERYLSRVELDRLTKALAEYPSQSAANAVRLLLLTGARRGETLAARWEDFNLDEGVWVKPGATTKQRTEHRVQLSAPVRLMLTEMRDGTDEDAVYLFPGRGGKHRADLKRPWAKITQAAGLKGVRLHDLRHTFASVLAGAGLSLHTIGALLGHTQPQTTARYAHLMDDPLREAAERAGAILTGAESAEIIDMKGVG